MAIETDKPFHWTFDGGNFPGPFLDNWGVDTSTPGQVTFANISGMKELAGDASAGHGYGTYTVNAEFNGLYGGFQGAAIVLWPGNNVWPGGEINLAEVTPDGTGRQYGTLHWADFNGNNAYDLRMFDGVPIGQFHNYSVVWEPGRVTWIVDGQVQGSIDHDVPLDYDHGGVNNTIGFLNQGPNTSLIVRSIDYTPLGPDDSHVAAAPVPTPAPTPAPAPAPAAAPDPTPAPAPAAEAPIDWNALAAQVEANFAATGSWSLPSGNPAPAPAPAPAPSPAPAADGAVDWNALAAIAQHNYETTGQWFI